MTDECLLREVWESSLLRGCEKFIPHLHLHDCITQWIHRGLDIQVTSYVIDSRPTGLIPDKSMLRLFLLVVHLFIQPLITFNALFIDAHCKQVFVHVVVPGGRRTGWPASPQRHSETSPRARTSAPQCCRSERRWTWRRCKPVTSWGEPWADAGCMFPHFQDIPWESPGRVSYDQSLPPNHPREQERTWGWGGSNYVSYLRCRWSCFLTCSPQLRQLQPTPSCCWKM